MIVCVIPAKGGSGRLPNKNMIDLNGRPMIDYTIMEAKKSKRVNEIYVSTDSDAIAAHAKKLGVKVIRRDESLGGETLIVTVYRHALAAIGADPRISILVGLQPDHPDRDVGIDEALEVFEKEGADRLASKEANGNKNGSHYILSRHFLDTDQLRKEVFITDDCTNVHYAEDLHRASERLKARGF